MHGLGISRNINVKYFWNNNALRHLGEAVANIIWKSLPSSQILKYYQNKIKSNISKQLKIINRTRKDVAMSESKQKHQLSDLKPKEHKLWKGSNTDIYV